MPGLWTKHGLYVPFPAWRDEPEPIDDWTEAEPEEIAFPEPEPDAHLEAQYDEAQGDGEEPF